MSTEKTLAAETEFTPSSAPSAVLARIVDNPIFVKHLRSRLRRAQFLPAAAVVLILCMCIGYGGYALNGFHNGGVYGTTMTLQVIILSVIGATQIGGSVGGARESGIIDFHRVTPMSPLSLTLGFFFGAPVREYILFALTIPLSLICVWYEAPYFTNFLETMAALFVSSWLMHALALLTALTTKKPKAGGKGIIGLIVFVFIFGGNFGIFALGRATRALQFDPVISFYGHPVPWLVFVLIYAVPTLFFVLLAAVRKMRSERAHPYTKPEAIGALALLAVLLIGAVWGVAAYEAVVLVVVYALVVAGSVLIATVTPNLGEYVKGVRRADREGLKAAGPWADWSLNRLTVVVFAAIVLVAGSFAAQSTSSRPFNGFSVTSPEYSFSITIATAVFVVAYVGLSYQAFLLIAPKRGATLFALFLFLAWLVPIMVGTIVGASGAGDNAAQFILALSPVTGIGLSAGLARDEGTRLYQAAALCPAILFAFVANNVVIVFRRRADAAIHRGAAKPTAPESAEILV